MGRGTAPLGVHENGSPFRVMRSGAYPAFGSAPTGRLYRAGARAGRRKRPAARPGRDIRLPFLLRPVPLLCPPASAPQSTGPAAGRSDLSRGEARITAAPCAPWAGGPRPLGPTLCRRKSAKFPLNPGENAISWGFKSTTVLYNEWRRDRPEGPGSRRKPGNPARKDTS